MSGNDDVDQCYKNSYISKLQNKAVGYYMYQKRCMEVMEVCMEMAETLFWFLGLDFSSVAVISTVSAQSYLPLV